MSSFSCSCSTPNHSTHTQSPRAPHMPTQDILLHGCTLALQPLGRFSSRMSGHHKVLLSPGLTSQWFYRELNKQLTQITEWRQRVMGKRRDGQETTNMEGGNTGTEGRESLRSLKRQNGDRDCSRGWKCSCVTSSGSNEPVSPSTVRFFQN